jgi:ribosomal protein S18 acetylase RimI-like enzyme
MWPREFESRLFRQTRKRVDRKTVDTAYLDNPVWNSLTTCHSDIALGGPGALRYPSDIAPFVDTRDWSRADLDELAELVLPGEQVCAAGVRVVWDERWEIDTQFEAIQMVWPETQIERTNDSEIVRLTDGDVPAMLELTALVYPAYFREGTARLGAYFGIKQEGRLAAMAGIRLAMTGFQEISAVCTHPDYRGRGYATSLAQHLVGFIQDAGDVPFLHTEEENEAARSIYHRLGFVLKRKFPVWIVTLRQG